MGGPIKGQTHGQLRIDLNKTMIASVNHPPLATPLADRLTAAGLRLTAPRRAVATVLETSETHLAPAEVLERARAICPDLGRATVYRTIDALVRIGALRPLYLGDGPEQRFALAEGGHHHLVCAACGTVVEFDDCPLGDLETTLAARTGFRIHGHLLELFGRCPACA